MNALTKETVLEIIELAEAESKQDEEDEATGVPLMEKVMRHLQGANPLDRKIMELSQPEKIELLALVSLGSEANPDQDWSDLVKVAAAREVDIEYLSTKDSLPQRLQAGLQKLSLL
jgi:Protein of unknown function (DUF3775)